MATHAGVRAAHRSSDRSARHRSARRHINLRLASLDAFRPLDTRAPEPEVAEQMRRAFFDQMQRWIDEGYSLHVFCSNDGEKQRFEELWRESRSASLPALTLRLFARHALPRFPLARRQARGRHRLRNLRPLQARAPAPQVPRDCAVADWTELQEGDFVVHVQHGIGKYLGLKSLEVSGATARKSSPSSTPKKRGCTCPSTRRISSRKYIGAGKRMPKLHELGGTLWQRQKFSAERAIMDLAARAARNPGRARRRSKATRSRPTRRGNASSRPRSSTTRRPTNSPPSRK